MKTAPALRALPLAIALSLGSGWAAAQSSATGAPAGSATPPTAHSAAGTQGSQNTGASQKLSHGDREFIEDAAKGGLFEVESGKLAASKASDPAVKDFANTLVQDHTKANDELKQIAQSKGVQVPDKLGWGEGHELKKLGKLDGKKFDQEFARNGVKDHQKDVKKFEKASKNLKDPDLKAWAEKTLPVLQKHLEMAQKLPEAGANNAHASAGGPTASKKNG